MRLSVLIPTWRRPAELLRCLEGLDAQSRPPDEVVVTMRRDDDATASALRELPPRPWGPRVLTVERPGVVASMNAGFEAYEGDVLCMSDDDTVAHADWLERIEQHFAADGALGGLGGRDFVHGLPEAVDPPAETVGVIRWFGRAIGNHHRGVGPPREVDVLKGVNMSFRREALAGRSLDERLRGEGAQVHFEIALCLAVKRARWRLVYDPAVAVDHYPARRFGDDQRARPSPRALADEVHNETYVLLRWLPWWRKPLALAYGLLVGSRRAPGLAAAVERALRGQAPRDVLGRLEASTRARLDAVATWRAAAKVG
jgi:GT2 family glycosyltransferase